MWEVNIKINNAYQIKSAFAGDESVEKGAMHTYDFGFDLIRSGETVDYGDIWYKDNLEPRTVIGQKGVLEYVILIIDGRSKTSVGMSLYDTVVELKNRCCYWGYNLDDGDMLSYRN